MTALELTLPVEPAGPAAAFTLTEAQVDQLGGGRRAPVLVTVAGRTARLRVAVMGGCIMVGLSKASRAQLGVDIGDTVDVRIELDTAERTVEVPALLAQALAEDPTAQAAFDALPYTRRKEIAAGVRDARQEQTRQLRLAKALAELGGG